MNYYSAIQLKTNKWLFTCENGNDLYPVGYCRNHQEGHNTKREAELCYRNYILDHKIIYSQAVNLQKRCQACGEWTSIYADIEGVIIFLCLQHKTRKVLEDLYAGYSTRYSNY